MSAKSPRRIFLNKNTPAEIAIFHAMQEVERAGAHEKLTEAVTLLAKAKDAVGDYVDLMEEKNEKPTQDDHQL